MSTSRQVSMVLTALDVSTQLDFKPNTGIVSSALSAGIGNSYSSLENHKKTWEELQHNSSPGKLR